MFAAPSYIFSVRLYRKAKMFHRRAARVDGGRTQKKPPAVSCGWLSQHILTQQLQHTGLGAGTHGLTHQLALLEHQQGGDAHHPELCR